MELLAGKLYQVSIMALPFLLAVTWREAMRGYIAHRMGDWSVAQSGRLSANPLNHADPVWTGLVPVVAFVVLNFPILLGQAKPIDIRPTNFKDINKGILYVAIAGPAALFFMAILWAYILRFGVGFGLTQQDWVYQMSIAGLQLSCIFMVIGLLPIPGLDGGKILEHFLPHDVAQSFRAVEPYGFFIVITIFIFAQQVIIGPASFIIGLVAALVGV